MKHSRTERRTRCKTTCATKDQSLKSTFGDVKLLITVSIVRLLPSIPSYNILVIDDNEINQVVACNSHNSWGCHREVTRNDELH